MSQTCQEHSNGCGVAALAMLLDQTYAEVAARYPMFPELDRPTGQEILHEMEGAGYDWRCVFTRGELGWPPKPFAERHLCLVENPTVGHWVVMNAEGIVLDPLTPTPRRLEEWNVINAVHGFTKREAKRFIRTHNGYESEDGTEGYLSHG